MDTSGNSPEARETRCRVDDFHLTFFADTEIVNGRAQWWDPRMNDGCIASGTRGRRYLLLVESRRQMMSGRVWRRFARRRIASWARGASSKFSGQCIRGLSRGLPWKLVGGKRNAKARLPAKGNQGPDSKDSVVGKSGRVSLRSSHPQAISLCAQKKMEIAETGF